MNNPVPLAETWTPVKLRVDDYLMLDAAGALDAYGRTELIDGEIVYMNAQHRPHARIKTQLAVQLAIALDRLGSSLEPLVEGSVALPTDVAEPDISITSEPRGTGLIPLGSLKLVIEIADTTLVKDVGRKAELYAGAGIPEYWIADVDNALVRQLWQPVDGRYAERRGIPFGDPVSAATIPDLTVPTDRL